MKKSNKTHRADRSDTTNEVEVAVRAPTAMEKARAAGIGKPAAKRTARERLRRRLHALVKVAMATKGLDFTNVKIAYELLLKDEAAEAERQKAEAAKAAPASVAVTQEEMCIYVRRLLGKEITL